MKPGSGHIKIIFLASILFTLSACSSQNSYRTLSFFFDGVPNPEDAIKAAREDSVRLASLPDSTLIASKSLTLSIFIHEPYREKECSSCHNRGSMGSLNNEGSALCYQCHTDFGEKYSVQHGPVGGGYCSSCHQPHKSKLEHLLLQEENLLCFQCHESGTVEESIYHNISEVKDCNACHDPHGSNNYSLIDKGACYICHDNFADNFSVVHGPVDAGLCSVCHNDHSSGSNKMILERGNMICNDCHGEKRLLENELHKDNQDMSCTECHDPHGGEDRFMFK